MEHQLGRGRCRIVPLSHRNGASMSGRSRDHDLQAYRAGNRTGHADRYPSGRYDRPLLDVDLEIPDQILSRATATDRFRLEPGLAHHPAKLVP